MLPSEWLGDAKQPVVIVIWFGEACPLEAPSDLWQHFDIEDGMFHVTDISKGD